MKRNILLFTLTLLVNLSAKSQAGTPDNSFGTNGRVNLAIGVYDDHAYAVAIQPDGKIVIAGPSRTTVNDPTFGNRYDFAVSRLNPDGTLDNTFDGDNGNDNGKVIIPVGDYGGFAHAVKIQPDGKILVAGYALNTDDLVAEYAVIRLETNGSLDGNFGNNGRAYFSIGPFHDLCYAIALQTDGRIVLAGESNAATGGRVFSAARLTSSGGLDPLFNNGAPLLIPINSITNEAASAVAIQPDGKIVIAGSGATSNPELRHFAVARVNADGSPDSGFDTDGQIVLFTSNSSFCRAMALQPDGKILLAGGSVEAVEDYQIVRLESNGSYDNSFGADANGRVFVPVGTGSDHAYSMVLQPDGKIVVAGQSQNGSSFNFSAIRLNTNGNLDICFDGDGKVILPSTTLGGFGERNRAMELQPDGRIVLAGINGGINTFPTDPAIDFIVMRINGGSGSAQDNDGDGYTGCTDCDDNNPNINPGAVEICNGSDDNCNGQVDEGLTTTFYRDFDGDGFGSSTNTIQACTVPSGYVTNSTDCNDNNNAVHPGVTEICNGIDDDCDGQTDEGITISTWYRDLDGDSYGNLNSTLQACTAPAGYVANNTDCNDNNNAVHPGATEICNGIDDNCNGQIDEGLTSTFYRDLDGDGYGNLNSTIQACTVPAGYVANNTDCNDNDQTIYPGALENVCNGVDNDCDGQIDEDTPKFTYYFDGDGDGWGIASQTIQACAFPAGYAVNPGDCNDINSTIYPGATEVCNGIDEDCDGQIDEGAQSSWYIDNDGDGYGNPNQFVLACTQPAGYISNGGDCNDDPATGGASIYPGATEICNGIDDNCDGVIDEGLTLNTYYRDVDGDGYGITLTTVQACTPPAGYSSQSGDCNDNPAAGGANIHPGATEVCNGVDDDCNGQVDEGFQTQWYIDNDGDGYGNPAGPQTNCTQPLGYVSNNGDCNDNDPSVNPAAPEICNLKDDNCDGQVDEGFATTTYYKDADSDGYGNASISVIACMAPRGYVTNNTDCDDGNDTIHPNATEYCNGIDENCDGVIDDNPVLVTWYRDADNDGWGNPTVTVQACTPPPGYIREAFDCDDGDAEINPDGIEVPNGKDDDCNGQIDEGILLTFYRDFDNDSYGDPTNSTQAATQPAGYVSNNTDCNDNNAAVHPGATEVCNNADDDCDGQIDEGVKLTFYRDVDGDGFGDPNNTKQACTAPSGYASNNTDCNDGNAAVHPEAIEVCNNIDDDCDGQIDEGVQLTFYRDTDGDGFGDLNNTTQACTAPTGYVSNSTDCDDIKLLYADSDGDGFGAGSPVACGVITNTDCNDNNTLINPNTVWYLDADNDSYYTGSGVIQCSSPGTGYKITGLIGGGDCIDNNAGINPGATEQCGNTADDDCDGQIDENCPVQPVVIINDVSVYESEGQAVLTVSLSMISTQPIKINYKTIDGTAKKPKDYKNSNGTVTIAPGSLTTQISISIIQDNITEGPEYFDVQISLPKITGQPQPAIIGDEMGRVTILDGAPPITTASGKYPVTKKQSTGAENFIVTITPNPTNAEFLLNIQSTSTETANIRIFDSQGKLIKLIRNRSNSIRFGNELGAGIYMVEVSQGTNKKTIKVVKLN